MEKKKGEEEGEEEEEEDVCWNRWISLVMYSRADKAVSGHRNNTLGKPTYLDKARGKVRRFLILGIFSTRVFISGRYSIGGCLGALPTLPPRHIFGHGRIVSHQQERSAGRRGTGFCLDLGSRDRSPSPQIKGRAGSAEVSSWERFPCL
jgi:hypothetical protein